MTDLTFLSGFVAHVRRVQAAAQRLGGAEAAVRLSLRLGEALRRMESDDTTVPVVRVVLLGGTGVGKSALFNALVGRPGASPASDDVRCFTQRPFVAVSRTERPLLNLAEELQPQYIDVDLGGMALIDTPDIDGALKENWHVTRAIVRRADVVIYVTMPDRRAEFQVHEEVRQWAALKRWFFVLNKADQVRPVLDEVRRDFDRRLADLGFEPNDEVRFVVSATDTADFDFARLRKTLFSTRMVQNVEKLRADGFLGYTQHAASDEILQPLEQKLVELDRREQQLNERLKQAYREGLEQPLARQAFRVVVRESAWRYLGERIGWLMGLAVWLRARLSALTASYYVARLGWGRWSVGGLAKAAVAVLNTLLRGTLPLHRILSAMGPRYREELRQIQADARRYLQDLELAALAPAAISAEEADSLPPEEHGSESHAAASGRPSSLVRELQTALLRTFGSGAESQEIEQLQTDLDNLAQRTAQQVGPGWVAVTANLIPTAFAGHVLWRVGEGWWSAEYLPGAFYGMAALLLLTSLLPGYLLLVVRMRRFCRRLDPVSLVAGLDQPLATAPLRSARERLGEFLRDILALRGTLQELRRELDLELPSAAVVDRPRPGVR